MGYSFNQRKLTVGVIALSACTLSMKHEKHNKPQTTEVKIVRIHPDRRREGAFPPQPNSS